MFSLSLLRAAPVHFICMTPIAFRGQVQNLTFKADNILVIPFISGEEDKLETEAQKILGTISSDETSFTLQSKLKISAACNRVPVLDGHTACVSLRFQKRPPPSAQAIKDAMREYVSEAQDLDCPSAPDNAIFVFDEDDRPQPRLDRDLQRGYTVSVGRVREDESGIFDIKFVALSHNSKLMSNVTPEGRFKC